MAWWKMCVPKDQGYMGFRDINCFNLALLAKQGCRLLDNPDSLCAKIFRAKYFPEGALMNANLRKGPLLLGKHYAGSQLSQKRLYMAS